MKAVIPGLMIPFVGTAAGAACVFFLKNDLKANVQRALTGFAGWASCFCFFWTT